MSTTTVKTDVTTKVLPRDKSGLPWEVWQMIFSCLSVRDLCRVAQVSKTWHDLVLSIDMTRWKELYLACKEWKHPFWPLNTHTEPFSWRLAYKDQYMATHFWMQGARKVQSTGCMTLWKRNREQDTVEVGPGLKFQTLKSALAAASDYDRILIHPGIYDEQLEMSLKMPLELVGLGELGSVILVACIEQQSVSVRLTNLVLRAPWFTTFILKVRCGYLQVDSCIVEDGMLLVQNPGCCCIRFCTFRHAAVVLQHVNTSMIQNCEFCQSDNANIILEGYLKEERNWAYPYLRQQIDSAFRRSSTQQQKLKATESLTSTIHSTITGKSLTIKTSTNSVYCSRIGSQDVEESICGSPKHLSNDLSKSSYADKCKSVGRTNDEINVEERSSFVDKFSDTVLELDGEILEIDDESADSPRSRLKRVSDRTDFPQISEVALQNGYQHFLQHLKTNSESTDICKATECQNSKPKPVHLNSKCFQCAKENNSKNGMKDAVVTKYCVNCGAQTHPLAVELAANVNQNENFHVIRDESSTELNNSLKLRCKAVSEDLFLANNHDFLHAEVGHCHEKTESSQNSSNELHQSDLEFDNSQRYHAANHHILKNDNPAQNINQVPDENQLELQPLAENVLEARQAGEDNQSRHSSCATSSTPDVSILDDLESGRSSSAESDPDNSSSSSDDSEVEGFFRPDADFDLSDGEESVIMLPLLQRTNTDSSVSANGVNADVGSICSQTMQHVMFSAHQDEEMLHFVNKIQGCLIHQCRMINSKGGVMVSLQAHALVSESDISNVGYGIRCIQNSRVVILKNHIHHCRTSGIFMRLASSGIIAGNDIHSNNEAGIDIRKNADPIVQHNCIHHGKRSGVVVLGSGRGQIKHNSIYNNSEAGIYILYGGNPTVCDNDIYGGKAAGVAINEGGFGVILDNTVRMNQWGGIDIRHGSCPIVRSNTITDGLGDGIVIGNQGQGIIESNIISNNAGSGMWIVSAGHPYIHGNQISNNGDTGIMMVNKMDTQHKENHLLPVGTERANFTRQSPSLLSEELHLQREKCQRTTLQYNSIFHNSGRGIIVEIGNPVDIIFNAICTNHQDGLWINQDALVLVKANNISSNQGCGLITGSTSNIQVLDNGIYDNANCGIHCQNSAKILQNDIVGNQAGGIILENITLCEVSCNRIQAVRGCAIKIASTVTGTLAINNNSIYSNGSSNILDLSQQAAIWDNHITPSKTLQVAGTSLNHQKSEEQFDKSEFLSNPPAKPIIDPPPLPSVLPTHNVSTITTVTVPPVDGCQQGSKLCIIV